MHCGSCTTLIDEAIEDLDGVRASTTSLRLRRTTVTFDTHTCNAATITATITELGYTASLLPEADATPRRAWFRRTTT